MKVERLTLVECEFMPAHVDKLDGVLYVSRRFELAIHLCACGCRGAAVTPLDPARGWELTQGPNGPTLTPSIGHQHWACKSHYHVTDGAIVPC